MSTVRFARTTGGSSGAAFCTERKRSHGQGIQCRRRSSIHSLARIPRQVPHKGFRPARRFDAPSGRRLAAQASFFHGAMPAACTDARRSGILAASIFDIDFKTSFLAAIMGLILSGIIMATISFNIF